MKGNCHPVATCSERGTKLMGTGTLGLHVVGVVKNSGELQALARLFWPWPLVMA